LGAYTASRPETGLLISSVYISDLVDSSIGVYSWIPCIILRCGGSINRSERRDRSMKKLSEYLLGRLMSGASGGADLSGDVAAVERHEIFDGEC
jgi:hypothetical protein